MKRLLILSLLMMQGLWGAAAADMPASVTVQTNDGQVFEYKYPGWSNTLNGMIEFAKPSDDNSVPLETITSAAFKLVQDLCQQIERNNGLFSYVPIWLLEDTEEMFGLLLAANYLDLKDVSLEVFIKALYIAWLNAHPTQTIIGRQTIKDACVAMGIDNIPSEWSQLIIDVSDHLRHGITSLHTRPGTIAYLVANNKMPVVHDGSLSFFLYKKLTVCDAWNIPNPKTIIHLDLSHNRLTALASGTFAGLVTLVWLYLNNNQLTTLPVGVFAGLRNLNHIYLGFNSGLQLDRPGDLALIKEEYPEWFTAP